ncbi:hypothetical protein [Bacillus testis]|uniref:hypothetical protein n=1 Tax=Bacillus testis TaxID=1622072 RepID=UPI00067EDDE6|nr:hypothetical protein [Bacillus testis]
MSILFGILIAIILYFRIKRIIKIFFSLRFWLGLVLNGAFFYIVSLFFSDMVETLSYYIDKYIHYFAIEDLDFVAMISAYALCFIVWVFLCNKSKAFATPFIFVLSVVTLGLVIFNISDGFDSSFEDGDNYDSNDSSSNQTWIDPHEVRGYERSDGTYVESYYRDGDGNTNINRGLDEGGGYYRKY